MTTNEERREVTEELRKYLSYAKKHDADENTDPCIHGNKMFRNIAQTIGGGISNITDTYEETLVKLIKIIEPEPECICNNSYIGGCTVAFKCSGCGESCFYPKNSNGKYVKLRYCPNCGTKVI